MNMFCYQCQEASQGTGCTKAGACGKDGRTADLQDKLIYVLKGISFYGEKAIAAGEPITEEARFVMKGLFTTVTNVSFDPASLETMILDGIRIRKELAAKYPAGGEDIPGCAAWDELTAPVPAAGILSQENEDVRSLRELLIYGIKGIAAYADHAMVLGHEDDGIYAFFIEALASTLKDLSVDEMVAMVLKAGSVAVDTMALLDKANTSTYGNPEITSVRTGVGDRPGILVSGHDLKDIAQLLSQTNGKGVDVYTHGEMLPAHYYPELKKYDHLAGNYGGSWWRQGTEFESFNGPILMTTNCITPVRDSYKDRFYTTGNARYPGTKHIDEPDTGEKDFSGIIEAALASDPPVELENGEIVGGFAHNQVMALADKVVEAVKSGAVKRFVVMAGCDGRHKEREYFTEVAKNLPDDTIILTAGCAKYRYNKLELGDIGGIPRVLDAGQCNDSYSLAVIALKLKEVFELEDINELPISFDIAWYEQKAVTVLLALLFLGVKGIRLGPTLPAFLSPAVAKVLVDNFDIKPIGEVDSDIELMMAGK